MNKIYNVVWDAEKQCFVVASELAKGHKKSGSAKLSLAIAGALLVGGVSAPAMSATFTALKSGLDTITSYYSVNDGGTPSINYDNTGASGTNALAAGVNSSAGGDSAVAVGLGSAASGTESVAMGDGSRGAGLMTTGVGSSAKALADMATALGATTSASASNATAVGYGANAAGAKALASGNGASASGNSSTALGDGASATVADGVALGRQSSVNAAAGIAGYVPATATAAQTAAINATKSTLGAVSVGDPISNKFRQIVGVAAGTADSDAVNVAQLKGATTDAVFYDSSAHDSVTLGGPTYNSASRTGGTKLSNLAAGTAASDAVNVDQLSAAVDDAQTHYYSVNDNGTQGGNYDNDGATGVNALAAGVGATAGGDSAIAVGSNANASGTSSVAVGDGSRSTGLMTTSTGSSAKALADMATAVGATTSATGSGATAIGYGANAAGARSLASGNGVSASGTSSTALGDGANALVAGGVALGSQSSANTAAGIAGYVPPTATATQTAAINATKSTLGAVSVGDPSSKKFRQITGVAAGTADSDAVNVAQLKGATADAVLYDNGTHNSITLGGATYDPVAKTGGTKITNVANGVAPSDAVNKSQLDDLANTPLTFAGNTGTVQKKLGDTVSIQGLGTSSGTYTGDNLKTAVDANGVLQLQMSDKPVFTSVTTGNTTMDTNGVVITGGPSMTINGIDAGGNKITNVAAGDVTNTSTDAINGAQLKQVQDAANAGWNVTDANNNTANIGPNGKVAFKGDSNVTVNQVGIDNDGQVEVSLNKNLDLGSSGSITTGNTTVSNNGLSIAGGPSITANGIDAGGNKISNVATGTAPTDAVNVSQLTTTVAGAKSHYYSVNDNGTPGGNYDNDGATGTNALAAGMGTSAAGSSAVAVGNNANASGISSVAMGDGSRSTGLMTTSTGASAKALADMATAVGATTSATGSGATAVGYGANAAGARSLASGNGANASGASATALGDGASALVADGVALGSQSSANTAAGIAGYVPPTATTTQAAAITATKSTLGAVSVGDPSSKKFRQITGVAAGTADSDAVNVAQLKGATADAVLYDTGAHDSVTLGGPTYDALTKTGGTKITNVADGVAPSDAVNKSQLDDLADTPLTFAGNTGTVQKKLGDTVSIQGKGTTAGTYVGDNLRTAVDANGVLQIEMTDKPEFTSVTTGNTTIDTNGVSIAGGPSITVNGIDAGGTKITHVAAGTAPTDAVNFSQLTTTVNGAKTHYYSVNDGGTQGGNYNNDGATGANAIAAGVGAMATGASSTAMGSNAQANNDHDVALGAGSVTSRSNPISSVTVAGQTYQFAGANPTSVVSVGSKGNERQITNVAAGQLSSDSTDAVNGSQLYATNQAVDVLNSTVNNINGGGGIKYFHANSSLADSQAVGSNSVAVGPQAVSTGADSVAIGHGAAASTNNSVALGANSTTGPVKGTSGATIAGDNYTFAGANPTGTVSMGAVGQERTITNVAAGTLSSTSTDAVNGSQLYATNQAVDKIDGRVTNVENTVNHIAGDITNISTGQAGMFQTSTDQKAPTPTPTGNNSAAGGAGAAASGDNSLALGNGSQASANNSVAIGNASVADRANAVSIGSAGNERQITNVAAGTQGTDAVNMSQLKAAQAGGVQYDVNSDGSINYNSVTLNPNGGSASIHNVQAGTATTDAVNVGQLNDAMVNTQNWAKNYTDQQINQMGKRAYAGTASALATANIPQAYQPNQSVVGVGIGNYHGQNAISVGLSTITESGRYILKASATGSQQDGLGVGVGAGMAW